MGAYKIALAELDVKEIPGEKANPRIIEYHATTTLRAESDEVAWCAAFVNWCLKKASHKGSGFANARSFCLWGEQTEKPVKGDICVFWRGTPNSQSGHVGFYAGENKTHILVLGGNQGNKVCIMAYPKSQLLTIRRLPAAISKEKK